MKIQATKDYIHAKINMQGRESTILLPDGAALAPYANVLSVGPEVKSCVPGDRILFLPNSRIDMEDGTTIISDGCVFGKYVADNLN